MPVARPLVPVAVNAIAGAAIVARAGYLHWRGRRTRHWPSTAGRLTDAYVLKYHHMRSGPGYGARVEYEYDVGGRRYRASQRVIGAVEYATPARASAELADLEHAPLRVYYDPANPADAVLRPGIAPVARRLALGGVALLAVGVWFWWRAMGG
ncbi:MAG TPA: DUF3592 domain-containing protein [Gemmatimonadales bacterium]|nr:DUF3592 domain-containing protein [Gemmatimonadales bacterium]